MPDDMVCVECFEDDFLRDLVQREGSPSEDEEEECSFCRTVGASRVPAERLAELFDPVVRRLFRADQDMEMHQQEGTGEPLGDLLRDSLGALNSNMDEPDGLVRAVLGKHWTNVSPDDNYPDLDASWIREEDDWTAAVSYTRALETLEKEVWILGHAFHLGPGRAVTFNGIDAPEAYGRMKHALHLTELVLDPGRRLYRARVDLASAQRDEIREFLPPPVKLAKAARANLQGERVWYMAGESETARAELRPGVASQVSVVEFALPRRLRLCGLDRRLLKTSPFENVDRYVQEREVARVAMAMGSMFAKPIRPSDTDTDYLITQLLARMIRDEGFDGIEFPSSQTPDGHNYVLFDPTLPCEFIGPVKTYRCSGVSYEWKEDVSSTPPRARVSVARSVRDEDDDSDALEDDAFDDQ